MDSNMSITETSPPTIKEDSDESANSPPGSAQGQGPAPTPDAPKRKGGRKPIYATVEERKQRNRQAQAAFRERRTEYIKQLEEENKRLNATCNQLRAANTNLSDEFMMCRYKNSFLERILVEHAIDIEQELALKGWNEQTQMHRIHQDIFPPQTMQTPLQMQQHVLNRPSQSRRSSSSIAGRPTPAPLAPIQPPPSGSPANPTITSPSTTSPTVGAPGARFSGRQQMMGHPSVMGVMGHGMYATSGYQNHMQQLDREYDDHVNMMGVSELDTAAAGPRSAGFGSMSGQPMSPQQATTMAPSSTIQQGQAGDILGQMPMGNLGYQQFADFDSSLQFPQVPHGFYLNPGGAH